VPEKTLLLFGSEGEERQHFFPMCGYEKGRKRRKNNNIKDPLFCGRDCSAGHGGFRPQGVVSSKANWRKKNEKRKKGREGLASRSKYLFYIVWHVSKSQASRSQQQEQKTKISIGSLTTICSLFFSP
jgi:hypothetical protein